MGELANKANVGNGMSSMIRNLLVSLMSCPFCQDEEEATGAVIKCALLGRYRIAPDRVSERVTGASVRICNETLNITVFPSDRSSQKLQHDRFPDVWFSLDLLL